MTILVIDDELDTLKGIVSAIQNEGFRVDTMNDPYAARTRIVERPDSFDFAIVDKMLTPEASMIPEDEYPEPDSFLRLGLDLVRLIARQSPRRPVIFLSSVLDPQDRKELGIFEKVVVQDKGNIKSEQIVRLIRSMRY